MTTPDTKYSAQQVLNRVFDETTSALVLSSSIDTIGIGQGGNTAIVSVTGELNVQQDPTLKFIEDWSSGAIDTTNQWNAAVTSGAGTSVTATAGNLALTSGTAANNYAYITTKDSWAMVPPGFLFEDFQIAIPFAIPANTYCAFGQFNPAASPTSGAYATEGWAYEIVNGTITCVTWAGSARTIITSTVTVPGDASVHRYILELRGDEFYYIQGSNATGSLTTVASQFSGANGPNVNKQPLCMLVGVMAAGSSSSMVMNNAAVYIGDTTKTGNALLDTTYPQVGANVVRADTGMNFLSTGWSTKLVGGGLSTSALTGTSVLLPAIDTAGYSSATLHVVNVGTGVTNLSPQTASIQSGETFLSQGGVNTVSGVSLTAVGTNGSIRFPLNGRWLQLLSNANQTAGSTTYYLTLSTAPYAANVVVSGSVTATASGSAASGANLSGNPVRIGGAFNTTQPTVTTGQTVDVQATSRGAIIVATGVDALTVNPGNTANTTPWLVNAGAFPTATVLNTYSIHLTSNTTTTPTASLAYISAISISSEVGGTTSTVTIQDKSGTPLKLINGLSTTALTTTPTTVNFQTPVKMTGGIDIITAGAVAATIDVWVNYYQ